MQEHIVFDIIRALCILPYGPVVTSLLKIGQPGCGSKINRPYRRGDRKSFFYHAILLFHVKSNMFILQLYNDAEGFQKNWYIYFCLFVLLTFDIQDVHIFQREVTIG